MTRAHRCASGEKQREMQQGTIHGKHQARGVATCGGDLIDDGRELTGGKDDRVFRLDRVDAVACTEIDIGVSKMLDRLGRGRGDEP
jgi:hypothetical protein